MSDLDDLIAERVMGWTLRDWEDGPDDEWWADAQGKYVCTPEMWCPTTDDAQAVRALEALRGHGWDGSISMIDKGQWQCALYNQSVPQHMGGQYGRDTAFARAVCLAIVAAVGE